jgi:hypothetical protein
MRKDARVPIIEVNTEEENIIRFAVLDRIDATKHIIRNESDAYLENYIATAEGIIRKLHEAFKS